MNKKNIIITAAVTSVAVFILTTIFYNLPVGRYMYSDISRLFGNTDFSKFIKMETIVESEFMGEYNKTRLVDSAAKGYAGALDDEYTEYLDRDEYKSVNDNLNGGYKGIGVKITGKNGKIYVYSVYENAPAARAGVEVGDYIIAVDGKEYVSDRLVDAISDIRNTPVDGTVVLTIERNGEVKDIPVVCTEVEMDYVKGRLIENSIGYIQVITFGNNVNEDFEKQINTLKEQGMKSLIIDLRSNPGGALDSVTEMCDILLPEGTITTVKDKNGKSEEYKSDKDELDMPICVLINSESASASEVMAGALKDFNKATLIGEKSFGKGVVQGIFDLGDGTGFKLTVAKYYTPSGVCIDGTGIEPDIEVKLPDGVVYADLEEKPESDTQLEAAVEYLGKF